MSTDDDLLQWLGEINTAGPDGLKVRGSKSRRVGGIPASRATSLSAQGLIYQVLSHVHLTDAGRTKLVQLRLAAEGDTRRDRRHRA